MKLIKLSSNKDSFQPVVFNQDGMTIILGVPSESSSESDDSSSNGVGKSLVLRLVHFCLGASKDTHLAEKLSGWVFELDFSILGVSHNIVRASDDSEILLNGEKTSLTALQRWLNSSGAFAISNTDSPLSFRSLIKRFARSSRQDCDSPLATKKEQPAVALIVSLFLLGLDYSLAMRKRDFSRQQKKVKDAKSAWRNNKVLQELFASGQDAVARKLWLERNIPELEKQLENMIVSENYTAVEREIHSLTEELRKLRRASEVCIFKESSLKSQLHQTPDISRQELIELYSGIERLFKSETLRHFEEVEQFHMSLSGARNRRLSEDLIAIQNQARYLDAQIEGVGSRRDKLFKSIQGKTAFDEYRQLANEVASLTTEMQKIEEFLSVEEKLEKQRKSLRDALHDDMKVAEEYLESKPEKAASDLFVELTHQLYPQSASRISLVNNEGDNQLRFDLDVHLEASGSDGVSDAKILCFDWLVFSQKANHTLNFLWHDNRLFANVDAGVRARWFEMVINNIGENEQYIATINKENLDSMLPLLNEAARKSLQESIVLQLYGNDPTRKLLGVQVDLPRD